MQIPKSERIAIYQMLFNDGVMVAKKSRKPMMHSELKLIPNLHVIHTLKSLVSKNHVKECFTWNYYYWTLNNEGITYLRDDLHLPQQVVPTTLINRPRESVVRNVVKDRDISKPRTAENRGIYRRLDRPAESSCKQHDAGAGANELVFRGGFGNRNV